MIHMKDIFANMQAKIWCPYLSDLPYYKRAVWFEMKRLCLSDYPKKLLEDFSRYVFGVPYAVIQEALTREGVLIWDVEQSGENAFTVTCEVDQQTKEGDQTRDVSETYTVTVHVDADTVNDAMAFLETFFKLYSTATDKELAYYVEGNALEPISGDYLFSELVNPVFTADGDNVKVSIAVKFIDNQTKATQVSQYELTLHKDSGWKIIM